MGTYCIDGVDCCSGLLLVGPPISFIVFANEANLWSDCYPTFGRIIIQPLVGSDLCNLSNCTETQKVQFQALALRAGDFDLLSSSDCVWGKSGFSSMPSSFSATSRINWRCRLNCWASFPGETTLSADLRLWRKYAITFCDNSG
jgi:hypothetical protein